MAYYFGNLNKLVQQNKENALGSTAPTAVGSVPSGKTSGPIERSSGTIQATKALLDANKNLDQSNLINDIGKTIRNDAKSQIDESADKLYNYSETMYDPIKKRDIRFDPRTELTEKSTMNMSPEELKAGINYNPEMAKYQGVDFNYVSSPIVTSNDFSSILGDKFRSNPSYTSGEKNLDSMLLSMGGTPNSGFSTGKESLDQELKSRPTGLSKLLGYQEEMNKSIDTEKERVANVVKEKEEAFKTGVAETKDRAWQAARLEYERLKNQKGKLAGDYDKLNKIADIIGFPRIEYPVTTATTPTAAKKEEVAKDNTQFTNAVKKAVYPTITVISGDNKKTKVTSPIPQTQTKRTTGSEVQKSGKKVIDKVGQGLKKLSKFLGF